MFAPMTTRRRAEIAFQEGVAEVLARSAALETRHKMLDALLITPIHYHFIPTEPAQPKPMANLGATKRVIR